MKKIYYLIATAIMALTFASCEDVPAPFGQPVNPNKDTPTVDPKGTGTQADPFNVAAAVAKCKEIGSSASTEKYYVKGIASEEYTVGSYGNIEIKIVDVESSTETFTIYRCKKSDGSTFEEGFKVNVGDEFVVYGPIMNYKDNTPETATGAYIVSINGVPTAGGGGGGGGGGGDTPTPTGDGLTPATAFNAAAANAEAAKLADKATSDKQYYIKGKVAKIPTDGNYGEGKYPKTANYYISEDGKDANTFYVYASKYLNNEDYTAGTVLKVGDEVIVYGNLTNYGGTYETAQNKSYLYSLNGGGDTPSGTVGLDVTFDAGKATFTIEDKSIGDGITYVWSEDTTNKYMKASAYKGGAIAAESWLISPKFSLKTLTAPVLTFNNACNQVKTGVITDHIHVMVSTDGTNWTEATIANMPSGTNWTFVDSTVDMKAYAGKENVQIAFKYISTTSIAPTWEIKSVSVK